MLGGQGQRGGARTGLPARSDAPPPPRSRVRLHRGLHLRRLLRSALLSGVPRGPRACSVGLGRRRGGTRLRRLQSGWRDSADPTRPDCGHRWPERTPHPGAGREAAGGPLALLGASGGLPPPAVTCPPSSPVSASSRAGKGQAGGWGRCGRFFRLRRTLHVLPLPRRFAWGRNPAMAGTPRPGPARHCRPSRTFRGPRGLCHAPSERPTQLAPRLRTVREPASPQVCRRESRWTRPPDHLTVVLGVGQ